MLSFYKFIHAHERYLNHLWLKQKKFKIDLVFERIHRFNLSVFYRMFSLLLFCFVLYKPDLVASCGITTHTEIGN